MVANSASLIGMVDYFQSPGAPGRDLLDLVPVGEDRGQPRSRQATWPDCELACRRIRDRCAQRTARRAPLTPGGRVAMIQYVTYLDNDYSCRRSPRRRRPVAPVLAVVRQGADRDRRSAEVTGGCGHAYSATSGTSNGTAIPGANARRSTRRRRPTWVESHCDRSRVPRAATARRP